jgi:transposase
MLQPILRRTWSPKGQTPIHYQCQKHDRLSVISCLSLSPKRRRLNLYFSIYAENITSPDVRKFLASVRRSLGRRIILILDKWSVHKAGLLKNYFWKHSGTINVEWLPSYAPELNPPEQVWRYSKYTDLANFAPRDTWELDGAIRNSIAFIKSQQHLLRSFFKKAGLEI